MILNYWFDMSRVEYGKKILLTPFLFSEWFATKLWFCWEWGRNKFEVLNKIENK